MRNLPLILLLTLILAAAGCTSQSDRRLQRQLAHAESIMEARPDSALELVQSLTVDSTTAPSLRARHALLLSQALDKNHIYLTDDSLICVAEKYYEDRDDLRPLMLSYFYHGRVKQNENALSESMRLLTKSLECARLLGDDYWCGRAASQIAALYDSTNHNTDFLHYSTLAYEYFLKSGRQTFINYALYDVTSATFMVEDYDRAIELSKELKDSALKYSDLDLASAADALKAKAYYLKKDYRNAIGVYEQLQAAGLMNEDRYALLGLCYLATDAKEKIKEIPLSFDSVNPRKIEVLHYLYELAEKNQDSGKAQDIYGKIAVMNDSVLSYSLDQNFGQTLADLYSQERMVRDLELQNHRFYLSIILLVVLFVIVICLFYYKRQSIIIDRKIAMATDLEELLSVKENDLSSARETVRHLLANRYEFFNNLFDFYYCNSASKSLKKKIADEIDSIIEDFSNNEEKIDELERNVDKACGNIMSSIRRELPELKQADYLLFLYSVLGFSHNAIALLLKEEKMTAVYNRKRRLKDKIKMLEPLKSELFLSYLD